MSASPHDTCLYSCHFLLPRSPGRRLNHQPVVYTKRSLIKIRFLDCLPNNYFPAFIDGASRFIRFLNPRPSTGIISLNRRLVRLDVRRRKWLFPPLVRINFPEPVKRNLFAVALWVFNLYFLVLFFRVTSLLLSHKNPADPCTVRGRVIIP